MAYKYKEYVTITDIKCDKENIFRFWLEAELGNCDKNNIALIIMKNPSKADEKSSDQTVNRVLEVMYKSGFGKCYIMNLIPYYATDSGVVAHKAETDKSVYMLNDKYLKDKIALAKKIFVAWGGNSKFNIGFYNSRIDKVKSILNGKRVYCYKINKNGTPIHPSRNQWKKDITEKDFITYDFNN